MARPGGAGVTVFGNFVTWGSSLCRVHDFGAHELACCLITASFEGFAAVAEGAGAE